MKKKSKKQAETKTIEREQKKKFETNKLRMSVFRITRPKKKKSGIKGASRIRITSKEN